MGPLILRAANLRLRCYIFINNGSTLNENQFPPVEGEPRVCTLYDTPTARLFVVSMHILYRMLSDVGVLYACTHFPTKIQYFLRPDMCLLPSHCTAAVRVDEQHRGPDAQTITLDLTEFTANCSNGTTSHRIVFVLSSTVSNQNIIRL